MARELRKWADIDRGWLQDYLQKHELASEFDLDDELIGSQVSWVLSADEWARLRGAWQEQKQQRTEEVRDDAAQPGAAEDRLPAAETQLDSANLKLAEAKIDVVEVRSAATQNAAESAKELGVAPTERDKRLDEDRRRNELTQKALNDWGAFKELFRDCPDTASVDAWETLADSPLALFKQAEKLLWMQEVKAEEQKHQMEQEFEEEVTRAQNIIAGYHIYCQKERITPSLEHLLDHIPVMRTGHPPEVVREAWRREAESQES